MSLQCQKHLFSIEEDVTYLNGAAYSPTLKSSVERGIEGIQLKASHTHLIKGSDHFTLPQKVQKLFAQLINETEIERIAVISSVSYGMAIVANNIHRIPNLSAKKHIIQIQDEFPNNVYAFDRVCQKHDLVYKTIAKPDTLENRGKLWNQSILEDINNETAMAVVPHIHWIYGIKFDLEAISKRCKEVGALLVIDGTQSVGILDFDLQRIQPDALICAGYKWLLDLIALVWLISESFLMKVYPSKNLGCIESKVIILHNLYAMSEHIDPKHNVIIWANIHSLFKYQCLKIHFLRY